MSLRSLTLITLSLCSALLVGCVDTRASEGRCEGTIGGAAVSFAIDGDASEYHRDDDIFLDDDAPFVMSYGDGSVVLSGVLDDMPLDGDVGTHAADGELFHGVVVDVGGQSVPVEEASLTIEEVRLDRLLGALEVRLEGGDELRCTYDLRRAFELDTDD